MTGAEQVLSALQTIRSPIQQGEYDLHALAEQALTQAGIPWEHEVRLAPRCRIDLMADGIGIEIKKGKPVRSDLMRQLARYAACPQVKVLVALVERSVDLPRAIGGKPLYTVSLNRLWGIAL